MEALRHLKAVFGWILASSWQASVLAALALLLQWALGARLNPRWRYALWLLVLVRLILPALPESALSVFQFAPPPPAAFVAPVTEPLFVSTSLTALSPHASELVTRVSVPVDNKTPPQKMKDWNGSAYIANELIKAGAKLNLKMPNGQTQGEMTLAAAIKAKNPQLIEVLRGAGVVENEPAVNLMSPGKTMNVGSQIKVSIAITGKNVKDWNYWVSAKDWTVDAPLVP